MLRIKFPKGPTSNITLIRQTAHAIEQIIGGTTSSRKPVPKHGEARTICARIFHREDSKKGTLPRSSKSPYAKGEFDMYALPSDEVSWRLIRAYFSTTGLFVPCLHEETFETYRRRGPFRKSWLGILNLVFAMGTVGLSFGKSPDSEVASTADLYYQRALALSEPQIMRGTSHEIVQFLLLMETYLQGSQRSVQTWTIHGLTVESAFQAGLHSVDALEGLPLLEREMRKRTWYCCVINDRCVLDPRENRKVY